jgi:hypothetical protein
VKFFAFLFVVFSTGLFAGTNMMLPVLTCKLAKDEVKKLKATGGYTSESLTLLADFEDQLANKSGKGILLMHGREVGAVSGKQVSGKIGGAELGTFHPEGTDENGFKEGALYSGYTVTYNSAHSWVSSLRVKDARNQKKVVVELSKKNSDESASSVIYECAGLID